MTVDWRDEAAGTLAADHVRDLVEKGDISPGSGVLVMDDHRDDVASALGDGPHVARWWRRAYGGRSATPWPPTGPFAVVALRLPPAKVERDMALDLAAAALAPGGRLLVYGAKDEGVGSVERALSTRFEEVMSVRVARRCRVVDARVPLSDSSPLEGSRFATAHDLGLPELPASWVSFPGVFAHGRLDGGTRLLIDHLPSIRTGRVLDFGCGHGVLCGVLAARHPGLRLTALDVDSLALEAVATNVPAVERILSDGWPAEPGETFDLIVSNPPIHRGKTESLGVVERLVQGAPGHLQPRGELRMVVQRRLPVHGLLAPHFRQVDVLADDGPWRVWSARRRYLRRTRDHGSHESRR